MEQEIRFFTTAEGARIAYATVGEGPVLVHAAHWLSHLEFDWQDADKRAFFEALARNHTLVRYDKHGCGLSDRDRTEFSLQSEVAVLEGIIDHIGAEQLALLGVSQAGPIALAYAVRHPERVRDLVLYGTYSNGAQIASDELKASMLSLVQAHWGVGSRALADMLMPNADAAAVANFATSQRKAATADMASLLLDLAYRIDVTDLLAQVRVPTVVIHRDRDHAIPFHSGRELASSIPDVRFVPLEGEIHLPWLGDSASVLRAMGEALAGSTPTSPSPASGRADSGPTISAAPEDPSGGAQQTKDRGVYDLVAGLDVLRLSRYCVVGDYLRFDEVARSALRDAKQKITGGAGEQGARNREYPSHILFFNF